jgi:DNA-binding transcriptional regulator YhcF (GntR family)
MLMGPDHPCTGLRSVQRVWPQYDTWVGTTHLEHAEMKPEKPKTGLKENEKKWSKALWSQGWAAIPVVVLKYQRELKLDATDINIILHLVRHWWTAERLPYPSKAEMASCMQISKSTVQRHIRKLEKAGLIGRIERHDAKHGGQSMNQYDLQGLINKARPYAQQEMEERAGRIQKGKPRLKIAT